MKHCGLYRLKPYKDRQLAVLANWLYSRHICANTVTFSGLICGLLAAVWICTGRNGWGLVFILFSIFADMLDGTVARVSRRVSLQGKLFDSVSDRLVETACVGALIYRNILPWWGWALPLASIILLFNRFWAYRFRLDTSFTWIARFERMAAVIGLIIFPWRWLTYPFFILVTLGTLFTCLTITKTIFYQRRSHISVDPNI